MEGFPSRQERSPKLKADLDPKGMPYIEIGEPSDAIRDIVLNVMNDNDESSEAKKLREATGAVLETDGDDEIRIEFSELDVQPFVEYLNKKLNG